MVKSIALIRRRADLTHAQFVDYYENHHAPLAQKFLAGARHYQRRYLETAQLSHQQSVAASADNASVSECASVNAVVVPATVEAFRATITKPKRKSRWSSPERM